MKTFLELSDEKAVLKIVIVFGLLYLHQVEAQHRALPPPPPPPPHGAFNQYPGQNIFGNFFRPGPGGLQQQQPVQPQQFHSGPGASQPQVVPPQNNQNAPAAGPNRPQFGGQPPSGPGAGPHLLPPPPPPPPPPGKRRPPPPGAPQQQPRPRSIAVRPGPPQRGQQRQQRPPGGQHQQQSNGRNLLPPPPPPPPGTPTVPDTSVPAVPQPPPTPNQPQVLALTSNFGESSVPETTTRRDVLVDILSSTTEFVPSQTHNINFDFDGDQQQQQQLIGVEQEDGIFPQYSVINEDDIVSNDLSLVAPSSESNIQQENSPPFKLTPRGHSAPVIISQIPVKSFQSSNHLVKEPMPEASSENRKQDTYFDGEDLAPSGTQVLEQYYQSPEGSGDSGSAPSDVSPDQPQKAHAKASNSNNFYFRSQPDVIPTASLDDTRNSRKNRLLNPIQDHHNHSHQHNNNNVVSLTDKDEVKSKEEEERNEEVKALVDCGGRDLGFCDMSSKYPGHMMGNLMSDCQELVYRGFVPVPEDLDELGDSDPVAKYSNSSKSAIRAQTGSWSWKPYAFKKKQVCDSELRFIRPGYARDSTGKWQVIVQTEDLPQRVAIDLCHSPEKPCRLMSDCGQKSKCLQRYNFQHLLAVDPDNLHDCPTIRAFKFPSACVCHIEYADYF